MCSKPSVCVSRPTCEGVVRTRSEEEVCVDAQDGAVVCTNFMSTGTKSCQLVYSPYLDGIIFKVSNVLPNSSHYDSQTYWAPSEILHHGAVSSRSNTVLWIHPEVETTMYQQGCSFAGEVYHKYGRNSNLCGCSPRLDFSFYWLQSCGGEIYQFGSNAVYSYCSCIRSWRQTSHFLHLPLDEKVEEGAQMVQGFSSAPMQVFLHEGKFSIIRFYDRLDERDSSPIFGCKRSWSQRICDAYYGMPCFGSIFAIFTYLRIQRQVTRRNKSSSFAKTIELFLP